MLLVSVISYTFWIYIKIVAEEVNLGTKCSTEKVCFKSCHIIGVLGNLAKISQINKPML